jgi:hypothetical protein
MGQMTMPNGASAVGQIMPAAIVVLLDRGTEQARDADAVAPIWSSCGLPPSSRYVASMASLYFVPRKNTCPTSMPRWIDNGPLPSGAGVAGPRHCGCRRRDPARADHAPS